MKALIVFNLFIAVVLLLLGLAGILIVPKYVDRAIQGMRKLNDPDNPLFESWVNPVKSTDLLLEVYVYNLTNVEDVEKKSADPLLSLIGPYVYEESNYKDMNSISWFPDGTIRYKYHKLYKFRQDLSGKLSETDKIISVNFPAILAVSLVERMDPSAGAEIWKQIRPTFEKHETTLFPSWAVGDLLWHLKDPVFEMLGLPSPAPLINDDPRLWTDFSSQDAGYVSHVDKLSSSDSLGHYNTWAGLKKLDGWDSPFANMINGTDGSMFHSNVSDHDVLAVFTEQLMRSVNFTFVENRSMNGLPLKCFGLEPSQLLNEKVNPDNKAFRMKETGFLSLPLVSDLAFTKPFFLDAALDNVHVSIDGSNPPKPDRSRDDTELCVEPKTGLTMTADRRIQLNVKLSKLYVWEDVPKGKPAKKLLPISAGVIETWFPIMYVHEQVRVKSDAVQNLRTKVYSPLFIGTFGGIACCVLSAVFLMISILLFISHRKERTRRSNTHTSGFEKDPLINITR